MNSLELAKNNKTNMEPQQTEDLYRDLSLKKVQVSCQFSGHSLIVDSPFEMIYCQL